jgi:hypothetical protein
MRADRSDLYAPGGSATLPTVDTIHPLLLTTGEWVLQLLGAREAARLHRTCATGVRELKPPLYSKGSRP